MTRIVLALVVLVAAAACQREPAVVIRFDTSDLAGRHDLGKPGEVGKPGDLATAVVTEKKVEAKGSACKTDTDCVTLADGCCDCANGGKLRAVAKKDEAALAKVQLAACQDTMCTMAMSTDPTCAKRAACVDGACALAAKR